MDKKEKAAQKALGTFPVFNCSNCGKEFYTDEKYYYYTNVGVPLIQLCKICATAQFVCDRLMKPTRDRGEFTKEDD